MDAQIIASIITSVVSLAGTIIAVIVGMNKSAKAAEKNAAVHQAVTNERIEELTREVRKHNNFAERLPVIEEKVKVINHRLDDLEEAQK